MFDILVMHVLTYTIEVWGPTSFDSRKLFDENSFKHALEAPYIEKLNVKLGKYVLGVSRKSCNDVVRGELGRYPVLLMTMNQWFKYAKHCYSLPCDNFTRASLSGLCDYTTCSPYHVISSVYCRFNVVFNENALHHPALPLYVQEHAMLKYQRAWLSSINKGYNPKKPNKLKVYASIKKSFSLEKYVSC